MRTKRFKLLMAFILILALCFTFVACKPIDDDDDDTSVSASELIEEMVGKLQNDLTITNARRLNIDISGAATLEELEGENPLFWKYELLAKGNIALAKNSKEMDSNFRIELNSYTKEGEKANLFSLLYESEADESGKYLGSYFYLTLPGQETPLKINAIALLKLIPGADESMEPISITEYLGIGLSTLVKSGERVGADSYKFTTDMNQIWSLVQTFVVPILEDPNGLNNLIPGLGIDLSKILNEAVPVLFEGLTYKGEAEDGTEIDKPVSTVSDLLTYIEQNLPKIDIALNFNFNGNNFSGGSVVANYAPKDIANATHKFTLDLYTASIGAGKYVAYDEGYSLTASQRKEMAASSNLLTFSVDGKMNFVKGEVVTPYTIAINADVNPLVLVDGFDISKLANIGKLSLTVTDDKTGDTLLTLYCNGADKELIVSYKSPKEMVPLGSVAIGGEYSFEALGAIINAMSPPPAEGGGSSGESGGTGDEEAGQDVAGIIIKKLLSSLDFTQISTKGLIINNVKGIIDSILDNVDLGLGSSASLVGTALHLTIFGGTENVEIGIKENGFKYGVCNMPNKEDVVLPGHNGNYNSYAKLLDDTKTVTSPDVQLEYEFGESFKVNERGGAKEEAKHTFTINGKNRAGENTDFSAVYYGQTGFDANKSGKQNVTIYYGINSGLSNLLTNSTVAGPLSGLSQWLPLLGAHSYTVEVTVYPKVAAENVVLVIDGSTTMFTDESIAGNLNATLRYKDANGNVREVKVTDDMISCKKPVMENGKFLYIGKYTLDINYKGIIISQNVTVNEIVVEQNSKIATVGSNPLNSITIKMKAYTESGEIKISDMQAEKVLSAHSMDGTLEELLLDENGQITGYLKFRSTKFYVTAQYELNGTKRTFNIYFDGTNIESELGITAFSGSTLKVADNYKWVNTATYTLPYFKRAVNGKTLSYYLIFDETQSKVVVKPYNATTAVWTPTEEVSIKFTKTHSYDVSKRDFVELNAPEAAFELSKSRLTLSVGKYELREQIGNAFSVITVEVLPKVSFIDVDSGMFGASSVTSGVKINIDGNMFSNADEKTKTASLVWDKTSKSWKFKIATEGDSTTYISEDEAKIEISGVMYADTKWVEAAFNETSGGFLKPPSSGGLGKYMAYKLTVKVTIDSEVFEDIVVYNASMAPQA